MQQRLDAIAGRKSANVIDAWHIGTPLVAVKAKLAYGNFLAWLSEHLPSVTRQLADELRRRRGTRCCGFFSNRRMRFGARAQTNTTHCRHIKFV